MPVYSLPSDRLTDWTPGTYTGVTGGIAQYRPGGANQRITTIDVTASPYFADNTGVSNAAPAIQSAINAATTNRVVYLPAGSYRIASTITTGTKSITIRGDGIGQTILVMDGNVRLDIGSGSDYRWDWPPSGSTVTAGLTKGSTQVTIASTTNFSVGQIIRINFENQADNAAITAGGVPVISVAGFSNVRSQKSRVTAKTSTTLTFFPPIYHAPQAGLSAVVRVAQFQANSVGVEDLEIDCALCTNALPLAFSQTYNSWLYRVKSTNTANYHFYVSDSLNWEVRQCWLDGRRAGGTNGAALLLNASSGGLAIHSVLARVMPCVEVNSASCGNAFLYNVIERAVGGAGGTLNVNHAPHNSHNLYEGNITNNMQSDGYFGGASEDTFFRNWINAAILNQSSGTFCVGLNRWAWNYSFLGNILGWDGFRSGSYSFGNPNIGNSSYSGTAQPTAGDFWNDWKSTATLTIRASDTSGTLTMISGSFFTGQLLTVRHASGTLLNSIAGTVSGSTVPFSGGSGSLPPEGTVVNCWMGPGGYQELDLDVESTVIKKGNYLALSSGTGSIPAGESLGGDTLPDSLAYSAEPEDWVSGFTWPPISATNPAASQDYEVIPAGYWFVNGAWPSDTPAAPVFTTDPASQSVAIGATVTFSTTVSGSPTPTRQWRKNAVAISGQTGSSLILTNVQVSDQGDYDCVATNSGGTATSALANLIVGTDETAPTPNPSTIVSVTVDSYSQITVVATTSTDAVSTLVEYNHSVDGVYAGWQVGTTRVFSGLTPATTYSFRVKARDATGNETTESAVTQGTTGAGPVGVSIPNPLGNRGTKARRGAFIR